MGRDELQEEGAWSERLAEEEDWEEPRESTWQRVARVFGTSYGLSLTVHVGVLLLLAAWVVVRAEPERLVRIEASLPERSEDPEAKPEEEEQTPELSEQSDEAATPAEVPEALEVPTSEPESSSHSALSDPNVNDAIGVTGGPPAGLKKRIGRVCKAIKGGPDTEAAVVSALRWLKLHQSPEGRWSAAGWQRNCRRGGCRGPGHDRGQAHFDVGVSALALLAYLSNAHTPRYGAYRRTVQRGFRWLLGKQRKDGSLGLVEGGSHGGIYNHALATLAICELYSIHKDRRWGRSAQRALDLCVRAQNPGLGWRYVARDGENDTSVTGWIVLALKAGRSAGLRVPKRSFAGARAWLNTATDEAGRTGYQEAGGGSAVLRPNEGRFEALPVMTAVGLVCRAFLGERASAPSVRAAARILSAEEPVWAPRRLNFYYWYYGTYALFQVGGERWKRWNRTLRRVLLPHQRKRGCEAGSWDGVGEWCLAGGRVYATALNALTFEIYYRYERVLGRQAKR